MVQSAGVQIEKFRTQWYNFALNNNRTHRKAIA
jgi:hypothetical protein